MPWKVSKRGGSRPWKIIKTSTGKVVGSSVTKVNAKSSVRVRGMREAGIKKKTKK